MLKVSSSTHRRLWLVRKGDRIVGGVLATMAARMLSLDYYGGDNEAGSLGVSSLLYWKALCEAQELGFERFSFGRTGLSTDGLREFKRRWGGVEEKLAYRKIILGTESGGMRKRLTERSSRESIRSLYRWMPSFLHRSCSHLFYRHWA